MNSAQTTVPFPQSGRPVLARPHPRAASLFLLLLLVLFGMPPTAPVMAASYAQPDPQSGSVVGSANWSRPVDGPVVEGFSAPPTPWASGHRGVDLASPEDSHITAPAPGVVSFTGVVVDREVLSINHGDGYVSSFEPVESELDVGDTVTAGETLARLSTYDDGSAHCDSPCLHWGVRLHGEYINPLLLTGELEPSVLLPLAEE